MKIENYTLLYSALNYFADFGYLEYLGCDEKTHTYSYALIYDFSVKRDKKEAKGRKDAVIGQVDIVVYPNGERDGYYQFQHSRLGVTKAEESFKDFKNRIHSPTITFQIGYSSEKDAKHGILCTETELLRLMYIYFWGRVVDLFVKPKKWNSRANSLNARIGNSFEKIVFHEVAFYLETGLSFLNGAGRMICEKHGLVPGDRLTCVNLPTKEKGSRAPVKTDIIILVNGKKEIKISVKCAQSYSSDKGISILGTGSVRSKSGMAEVISKGSDYALKIFNWLNRKKLFKGLANVREYLQDDVYSLLLKVVRKNYRALVKLAVLGMGNPFSKEATSQPDDFIEYCLQDGHGLCCTAEEFCQKVDGMSVDTLMKCFPLSGTSKHTARMTMNTPFLLAS